MFLSLANVISRTLPITTVDAAAGVMWFLFNDGKVSECVSPPLEVGFIYIYRQVRP